MKISEFKNWYAVCTGNTCRSPLLQRIIMSKLEETGMKNINIRSRMATVEDPKKAAEYAKYLPQGRYKEPEKISDGTREIILHFFGDKQFVEKHRAKTFTPKELEEANLIITMSHRHKDSLTRHPEAFTKNKKCKVYTLGELIDEPYEDVNDPFGVDLQLLEQIYQEETGEDFEKEIDKALRGVTDQKTENLIIRRIRKIQDQKIQDYFSGEREKKIIMASYMPTYKQLTSMVDVLFKKGEVKIDTLEELFHKEMLEEYSGWLQYLEKQKDRTIVTTQRKDEAPRTLNKLCDLVDLYQRTTEICGDKKLETLYDAFLSDINDKIAKLFEIKTSPAKNGLPIVIPLRKDYKEKLGEEIGPHVISLAEVTPELINKYSLEKALAVRKLAGDMVRFAEEVCPIGTVDAMYQNFIGK